MRRVMELSGQSRAPRAVFSVDNGNQEGNDTEKGPWALLGGRAKSYPRIIDRALIESGPN